MTGKFVSVTRMWPRRKNDGGMTSEVHVCTCACVWFDLDEIVVSAGVAKREVSLKGAVNVEYGLSTFINKGRNKVEQ